MKHTIPVGTSEPQDFMLKDKGTAIVGTGLTVEFKIEKREGTSGTSAVAAPPTAAWLDQPGGTVRVTGTEVLAIGSYLVRYKLTDGAGKVGFVPNGDKSDVWHVVPVANY